MLLVPLNAGGFCFSVIELFWILTLQVMTLTRITLQVMRLTRIIIVMIIITKILVKKITNFKELILVYHKASTWDFSFIY